MTDGMVVVHCAGDFFSCCWSSSWISSLSSHCHSAWGERANKLWSDFFSKKKNLRAAMRAFCKVVASLIIMQRYFFFNPCLQMLSVWLIILWRLIKKSNRLALNNFQSWKKNELNKVMTFPIFVFCVLFFFLSSLQLSSPHLFWGFQDCWNADEVKNIWHQNFKLAECAVSCRFRAQHFFFFPVEAFMQ